MHHLRFLIDEDVDIGVVSFLRQRGHDVEVALKTFGTQTRDKENMSYARAQDRILVTRDRRWANAHRKDPKRSAMLLLWNINTQQVERLRALISVVEAEASLRPTTLYMWIGRDDFLVQR